MPSSPTPLPENTGLVFVGEKPWPAARLSSRQVQSLTAALNPSGRPNSDVLRHFIGFHSAQVRERTQVDFPLHFTEQEAALYLKPFGHLNSVPKSKTPESWLNPHAKPELRTALSRLERYLATPLASEVPSWDWTDSQLLPDATLLVVARDDDFAHGLLQSRGFKFWWRKFLGGLAPDEIVTCFPWPWSPTTLFSSLTREQEEKRHAVARAARAMDSAQVDSAVAAAYGWPCDLDEEELVSHLKKLNQQRAISQVA